MLISLIAYILRTGLGIGLVFLVANQMERVSNLFGVLAVGFTF